MAATSCARQGCNPRLGCNRFEGGWPVLGWPLHGRVLVAVPVAGAWPWCGWGVAVVAWSEHAPPSPPPLTLSYHPHPSPAALTPPPPPPPPEGEQGRILKREAAVHMSNAKLTATAAAE